MRPLTLFIALLSFTALAGCKEDLAALPEPVKMTPEALGHYCQMNLSEHPGPKAQVHLRGVSAPIYFAQVRDAIAYQRMPEQSHAIAAIYVNDMSLAPRWEAPGNDNWLAASGAHFVVGSQMKGGMGAPELVPFSDKNDAEAFVAKYGGRVLGFGDIADGDVLVPEEPVRSDTSDQDFIERLSMIEHEESR